MSQSIIQAAVTNKTLRLELTYRAPTVLLEDDDDTAELVPLPPDQPISEECASLLSLI
jgi:hypothetical protein